MEKSQPSNPSHALFSDPFAWQTSSRARKMDVNDKYPKQDNAKKLSGTKVRIAKPAFRQFQVEATDNFSAPVAKLTKWLANDPTNQKKFLLVRKGQNIINKSQRYEIQDTQNDFRKDLNIPKGTVASKLKKWQGTAVEDDRADETPASDKAIELINKWIVPSSKEYGQSHPKSDTSSSETYDTPRPASINSSFDVDDSPRPTSMFSRQKWLMDALHNSKGKENPASDKVSLSSEASSHKRSQVHSRPPRCDQRDETMSYGSQTMGSSFDGSVEREVAVEKMIVQSFEKLKMEGAFPKGDVHRTKQGEHAPKTAIKCRQWEEETRWVSKSGDVLRGFEVENTKSTSEKRTGPPAVIDHRSLLSPSYSLKSDISVDLSYATPSAASITETWSMDAEIETKSTPTKVQEEFHPVDVVENHQDIAESVATMDLPTVAKLAEKFRTDGHDMMKLLTKVQIRKEKLERMEKEYKQRSGPYGLLKPTWKQNKAKGLPSDGYTRSFLGNVAPKKTLAELP